MTLTNPSIEIALTDAFPHYKYNENKEYYNMRIISVYETKLNPEKMPADQLEVAQFLRLWVEVTSPGELNIHIGSLRKTAKLSGKAILQRIYTIARMLDVKQIHLEDKARLEFETDKQILIYSPVNRLRHTRKRIIKESDLSIYWRTVKVKTILLSPLRILCGEPAYYAEEGFRAENQEEIDKYNKAQVEMTFAELMKSKPTLNLECHMELLNEFCDLPVRTFFQDVQTRLRSGIPEDMDFDFISKLIEDLMDCEFIRHSDYASLTKLIDNQ